MRILESAPGRYDEGMRLLTFGRIDRTYDRLVGHVAAGMRVLDIGCGTGGLALRAARRGARVKGIDVNAAMLEVAAQRVRGAGLDEAVELVEQGVAELDAEPAEGYDAVMSGLCLSELSDDEIAFTLLQVRRLLRPGGCLLIADEVKPPAAATRWLLAVARAPFVAAAYLISGKTTRGVSRLPERVSEAGLSVDSYTRGRLSSFCELVATRPAASGERP
jgi:demethylmenaquinone methyltransferase/2-methoxy-6-polyprenyl-1,4-benzoquinol methylase